MIGKPTWFKRRTVGWGIRPVTVQGWIYVGCILALCFAGALLPVSKTTQLAVTAGLILVVILDTFNIMVHMPANECAQQPKARAERNAAWFKSCFLIALLVYQAQSALTCAAQINPFLLCIILGGALAKVLTYWYLQR